MVVALVSTAVLLALAIPYYAIYGIRPASFKLTAKVAKLVAIEVEVQADHSPLRDAPAPPGDASAGGGAGHDRPTAAPEE